MTAGDFVALAAKVEALEGRVAYLMGVIQAAVAADAAAAGEAGEPEEPKEPAEVTP